MSACTLYREIDALGGAAENEFERGYSAALGDVLGILAKRGHSEFVDPQAVLLGALEVLETSGRSAWHFQHHDTNATLLFANALVAARAAIARFEVEA